MEWAFLFGQAQIGLSYRTVLTEPSLGQKKTENSSDEKETEKNATCLKWENKFNSKQVIFSFWYTRKYTEYLTRPIFMKTYVNPETWLTVSSNGPYAFPLNFSILVEHFSKRNYRYSDTRTLHQKLVKFL